jgi:hypothetical protein
MLPDERGPTEAKLVGRVDAHECDDRDVVGADADCFGCLDVDAADRAELLEGVDRGGGDEAGVGGGGNRTLRLAGGFVVVEPQ